MKPPGKKAVHSLFLFIILALAYLPYSGISGSHERGQQIYEWRLLNGKLQVSSYPTAPSQGKYVIIAKSTNILYFYTDGKLVKRYRVATGQDPAFTPEGKFEITQKAVLDTELQGPRTAKAHEQNPQLGSRWLGLGVPPQADKREPGSDPRAPVGLKYGIHGTNEPSSIGKHISGGCIRMHDHDIKELYELVELGTLVEIRP
ncbi:MAG: L,D-transpeptidase [Firmicutes bacterium]|nr:L,D-transpeptidase [Bacillota bacterium]